MKPHTYFELPFGVDHGPMCRQCTGDYRAPATLGTSTRSPMTYLSKGFGPNGTGKLYPCPVCDGWINDRSRWHRHIK